MLRLALLLVVLATPVFAQGSNSATRAAAVDAINAAIDHRDAWVDYHIAVTAQVNALPAGPAKTAISNEWDVFTVEWAGSDVAAVGQINLAKSKLAAGDAATDPIIKGQLYGEAVNWSGSAIGELNELLGAPYNNFAFVCFMWGWSPSVVPPGL